MAGHISIDTHLAVLADRLPPAVVDELADGLIETWRTLVDSGLDPDAAAETAVIDFGDPDQIVAAFVAQAPGRRIALYLLLTAPLVAASWAATLLAARAWTWPIPLSVAALLGVTLVAVIVALVTSASSRHSYRRTQLGAAGGAGVLTVDVGMLTVVAIAGPAFVWPMAAAILASTVRIALTLRSLLRVRTPGTPGAR